MSQEIITRLHKLHDRLEMGPFLELQSDFQLTFSVDMFI